MPLHKAMPYTHTQSSAAEPRARDSAAWSTAGADQASAATISQRAAAVCTDHDRPDVLRPGPVRQSHRRRLGHPVPARPVRPGQRAQDRGRAHRVRCHAEFSWCSWLLLLQSLLVVVGGLGLGPPLTPPRHRRISHDHWDVVSERNGIEHADLLSELKFKNDADGGRMRQVTTTPATPATPATASCALRTAWPCCAHARLSPFTRLTAVAMGDGGAVVRRRGRQVGERRRRQRLSFVDRLLTLGAAARPGRGLIREPENPIGLLHGGGVKAQRSVQRWFTSYTQQ